MQWVKKTPGHLVAARALLAVSAILAGAAGATAARADTAEDTALAVPRVASPGNRGAVALPQPLSPSDAQRIRRIFALQEASDLGTAQAETQELAETTLLGPILADRYMSGPGRAK